MIAMMTGAVMAVIATPITANIIRPIHRVTDARTTEVAIPEAIKAATTIIQMIILTTAVRTVTMKAVRRITVPITIKPLIIIPMTGATAAAAV